MSVLTSTIKYNYMILQTCVLLISAIYTFTNANAAGNSIPAFSVWPDTAVTVCYNMELWGSACLADGVGYPGFYGQDGDIQGPTRSYTVLVEGKVLKDNVTGLIWEIKDQTAADGVVNSNNLHDPDNDFLYSWCDPLANSEEYQGWCDGVRDIKYFIESVNAENFGGFSDWRIPTVQELATLLTYEQEPPYFGSHVYWSITTQASNPQVSWIVSPEDILPSSHSIVQGSPGQTWVEAIRANAIAVRGGNYRSQDQRYLNNGDSTITDNFTNLQWQEDLLDGDNDGYPDTLNWQEAFAAAKKSTVGGHTDWRLPNVNELLSIIDYSLPSPALHSIFAHSASGYHHTSTTLWNNVLQSHFVAMSGRMYTYDKTEKLFVRLVRNSTSAIPVTSPTQAVAILQILSDQKPALPVSVTLDVNGDQLLGLEEVIFVLQQSVQ